MIKRFLIWWFELSPRFVVIQGGHKARITRYYVDLVLAARQEFSEDNKIILDSLLRECFEDALESAPNKDKTDG